MLDKGSEDFIHYIDLSLKDGLLSGAEWTVMLESAPSYDLSDKEAERLVIERCVERGAVIEHHEIQRLRDLIAIAAPDKVLEAPVQALLRRLAEERYRKTKLANPQAHIDRLVGERLGEAKLREEKPLRQKINERLHAAAGTGRSLQIEDWRRIYNGTLQELGISGGETSDLVGLFLDCRRELGIDIAEAQPELDIPAPRPPVEEKGLLPPERVGEPSESSSVLAFLGKLVLISLVVAVLVFLLLRFLDPGAGSANGSSISLDNRRCDGECETNLRAWNAGERTGLILTEIVSACDPYLSLPAEEMQRDAKAKDSDWKVCESPMILAAYRAGKEND